MSWRAGETTCSLRQAQGASRWLSLSKPNYFKFSIVTYVPIVV